MNARAASALTRKGTAVNSNGDVYVYNRTRDRFVATEVTVACTYVSRLLGLLGKTQAWSRPGRGLWIVPSRGIHTFGVMFPIDVLFLDEDLSVILVQEHIRPFSISRMCLKARSALQLPAHTAYRTGTKAGDRLEIAHMGHHTSETSGNIRPPLIPRQTNEPLNSPHNNPTNGSAYFRLALQLVIALWRWNRAPAGHCPIQPQ